MASLTVAADDAQVLSPFESIIADELNVKSVVLSGDLAAAGRFELQVVPGALGPRIGKAVQQIIGAVKKGEWRQDPSTGVVTAAGVDLQDGEYSLKLVAADPDRSAALPRNSGVVVLDTDLTEELVAEGLARDAVRVVQQARKDGGLHISDRIALTLTTSDPVLAGALRTHESLIVGEVLATSFSVVVGPVETESATAVGDDDGLLAVHVAKA